MVASIRKPSKGPRKSSKTGKKKMPAAQRKIKTVMKEFKEGKLKSSSGKKVTNPKQALAIGFSEARRAKGKKKIKAKKRK